MSDLVEIREAWLTNLRLETSGASRHEIEGLVIGGTILHLADLLAVLEHDANRIEHLEAENFMLAAGCCINPGQHGLVGDESGNSICTAHEALMTSERLHSEALAKIAQLETQLATARRDAVEEERGAIVRWLRGIETGANLNHRSADAKLGHDAAIAAATNSIERGCHHLMPAPSAIRATGGGQ